jgi:hypothetical protein
VQFSFLVVDLLLKLLNTSMLAFPLSGSTRNGGHEHEKSARPRIPKSLKKLRPSPLSASKNPSLDFKDIFFRLRRDSIFRGETAS